MEATCEADDFDLEDQIPDLGMWIGAYALPTTPFAVVCTNMVSAHRQMPRRSHASCWTEKLHPAHDHTDNPQFPPELFFATLSESDTVLIRAPLGLILLVSVFPMEYLPTHMRESLISGCRRVRLIDH